MAAGPDDCHTFVKVAGDKKVLRKSILPPDLMYDTMPMRSNKQGLEQQLKKDETMSKSELNNVITSVQAQSGINFVKVQFHAECGEYDYEGPIGGGRTKKDNFTSKKYTYKTKVDVEVDDLVLPHRS